MSKQVLDVQQMQHLQELGLDTSNASAFWCNPDRHGDWSLEFTDSCGGKIPQSNEYDEFHPAYTLQDVLDALPESILKNDIQYWLSIWRATISIWIISYSDDVDLITNLHHEEYESLIDAAYSMLCWAIENKFVETNKNE